MNIAVDKGLEKKNQKVPGPLREVGTGLRTTHSLLSKPLEPKSKPKQGPEQKQKNETLFSARSLKLQAL